MGLCACTSKDSHKNEKYKQGQNCIVIVETSAALRPLLAKLLLK